MQTSIIFFVVKCQPFRVKKSMRSFWNKKKWLKTIHKIKFRNNTIKINIKTYL